MSRKSLRILLVAAALVGVVGLGLFFVSPTADAKPIEQDCPYNQNKRVDYYDGWGPSTHTVVGSRWYPSSLCGGSPSGWGQVTSYPVTTCFPCN